MITLDFYIDYTTIEDGDQIDNSEGHMSLDEALDLAREVYKKHPGVEILMRISVSKDGELLYKQTPNGEEHIEFTIDCKYLVEREERMLQIDEVVKKMLEGEN